MNTVQNDCVITKEEKEKIVNDMRELLIEYDYNYEMFALETIVDEWADQKAELISAFKKHPNYIDGKFMIAFNSDFERTFDKAAITKFGKWLMYVIREYKDGVPDCIKARQEFEIQYLPDDLFSFFVSLDEHIKERTLSKELTDFLNQIIPEIRPHIGEKTSRVINKICTYLGYNKHPEYNREYAKFADGLNPLVIKRHTILSINPLDYLTMSFGNSWASCHTIDKNNKRNMPNYYSGCYSSGTISYMLDGSSMVFYTVDAKYDADEYWTQPKINRQMFHWGEEKLVQGRLYPQDNDDDSDAYAPYRNIVQQIVSTVFDFPNLWTLSRGSDAASRYIMSRGTHYRDYQHYANCTLSKKSGTTNENQFIVGHDPICVECGEEHNNEENINCCTNGRYVCSDCGCVLDEDEVRWVGDDAYCCDCATYCECCDTYERNNDTTWIECEDRYVCNDCLERYYTECSECGEYFRSDDITWVESADGYVCDDCLDRWYTTCEECGETFHNDSMTWVESANSSICDDCLEEKYDKCDSCDEYFLKEDMHYDENGDALCEHCYEAADENEDDEEC